MAITVTNKKGAAIVKTKMERMMEKLNEEKVRAAKMGETVNIGRMDDFEDTGLINYVLTGILGIDTNIYGIKKGAINVFFGAESSGKSSSALTAIEGIQMTEPDAVILYVDTEQTVNKQFASRNPYLNMNNIIFMKVSEIEQCLDLIKEHVVDNTVDYVVFDSVDSTYSKREFEKAMDENTMMEKAKALSRFMPQFSEHIAKNGIGSIIVQQLRTKMTAYGASEGRAGGMAMRFFPSAVLKFTKDNQQTELDGENNVNRMVTKIKNEKSKVSRPYQVTQTYINTNPNEGISIDRLREVVYYGKVNGLIEVAGGGWCTLANPATGEVICKVQGEGKLCSTFTKDLDIYSMLKMKIYAMTLPNELFIVKHDHIKLLLETENAKMKERIVSESNIKGKSKADLIEAGFNIEPFTFGNDFTPEYLLSKEDYDLAMYNLNSPEGKAKLLSEYSETVDMEEVIEKEIDVLEGIVPMSTEEKIEKPKKAKKGVIENV